MKYPINQKTEPMNEVQKVVLNIYKEFKRVCEENNLYFIASDGTLLGAVREGGFIPHDDDMDITMPINHAEKLVEIWNKKTKNPHYKIGWFRNYHCIKIHDARTTYIEFAVLSHEDAHEGIFLDIFPFVGLPNNRIERKKFIDEIIKQRQITSKAYYGRDFNYINELNKLRSIYNKYEVNKTNHFAELDVFYNVYEKDRWFTKTDTKFEDTTIPVPINSIERLESQYGQHFDKRLPLAEQISHHSIASIVDLHKPYSHYTDLLKKFNTQFLIEIENLTHSYYSTNGYSSYKQGSMYKLENRISELEKSLVDKDALINQMVSELSSYNGIKKSMKLLYQNLKRRFT